MATLCPRCGAPTLGADTCPRCGVIFAKAEEARLAADLRAEREAEAQEERRAALAGAASLFAWPLAALGCGALLALIPLTRFLVSAGLGMELHELGHAVLAWLGGYFAVPLPLVTFRLGEHRSPLVIVFFLALFAGGAPLAWRAGKRGLAAACALLLAAQLALTFAVPEPALRLVVSYGGCAGELWIAALLVAAFHLELPWPQWRKARLFLLFVGALVLCASWQRWLAAAGDYDKIPWGSIFGGDGDMDALRVAGLPPSGIVRLYLWTAAVSTAALAAQAAVLLRRYASARSSSPAMRAA